jgi:hypothetical protein
MNSAASSVRFIKHRPEYVRQLKNHPLIRSVDERHQVLERLQEYVSSACCSCRGRSRSRARNGCEPAGQEDPEPDGPVKV